jgi:hypothetical protein
MAYTGEETGSSPLERADLGLSDVKESPAGLEEGTGGLNEGGSTTASPEQQTDAEDKDKDEEEAIVYPERRGYVALSRAGEWLRPRIAKFLRPEAFVTFVVVVACVVFTFVQFQPSNLLRNTTISGGDTGAHVLLPWVAEHQVLSHLRLTGWTSSNWDGFPAITFYFPLPIYSIVALAQVIPYNIAFKLLTAAPMILMPVAAWLMGRISKAPFPVPAVLAASTLPYIFGTEFTIYGGNIASTLAGEFAFAWSLWFALVFFGIVMRGLQTGRYRAWAAVIFACAFMSHIDPAIFAGVGAIVLVVMYAMRNRDWRGALWWAVPTLVVGGLLAAWWAFPFEVRLPYVTNMGYQRITTFLNTLFPTSDTWLFVLAGIGAALSIARRRRIGEFFAVMAVLAALAFRFMPQSILWNARVLPFWFLALYLLGGLAVAEAYAIMAERTTNFMVTLRAALLPAPLIVLVLVFIWVGFPLRILPGEHATANGNYEFLGIPQKSVSFIPGWITWNYSGYQSGCPQSCAKTRWPEYQQIVTQLEKASKTYGCGNVMWEYQSEMNDYGTPDALTTLPYWTNGCIGSMEGLYYEASATTPFHFIDQSELSLQPSDPMVGIPYASSPDVALGVQHLQMLGVNYYMALNTELQQQAAADPSLKLISTFGPFYVSYSGSGGSGPSGTQKQFWKLYLVQGSPRVHPLANQPVVMKGLDNSSQPTYLKVMTTWYDDPSAWDVYLASSGPSNWARVPYGDTNVPVRPEPTTKVSDIVEHNASISFNVSRTGVPVVVTVSYFPNWQVSGAAGVYRISPNLMVVVPTSHHVSMWYGYTPVDYEGWGLTLLALVGLFFLIRHPVVPVAAVRRPRLGRRAAIGSTQAAVAGTVRNMWDDGTGPEEPSPPWPSASNGPTNGAKATGAATDGTDVAEPHDGAPAPYDQGEDEGSYAAAASSSGVASPGPANLDPANLDPTGPDAVSADAVSPGAAVPGAAVPNAAGVDPVDFDPVSPGPGPAGPGPAGLENPGAEADGPPYSR